jgi:hypothetical protein
MVTGDTGEHGTSAAFAGKLQISERTCANHPRGGLMSILRRASRKLSATALALALPIEAALAVPSTSQAQGAGADD